MKLTWREGKPTPEEMTSLYGAAVVHGNTALFSRGYNVYSYRVTEDEWTRLPPCKYRDSALAVVNDQLTTIGGWVPATVPTNSLLSLSGSPPVQRWEEVLPPMPTERLLLAAATTPTHLVVAGGNRGLVDPLSTLEVLSTETLQWSTASSLPKALADIQMIFCDGHFYLSTTENKVYSCSVEDLLSSSGSDSVWTGLARIPVPYYSSLASVRGRVLALGGAESGFGENPTGAIHCYDVATNSWSAIGEMPTPRYRPLAAVLPSNELVVVGGDISVTETCTITEIGILEC